MTRKGGSRVVVSVRVRGPRFMAMAMDEISGGILVLGRDDG